MGVALRYAVLCFLIVGVLCVPRRRRPRPGEVCAGCPEEVPINDPLVVQAAFHVIRFLNGLQPGNFLIRIRRAQAGVVAGTRYSLWLTILKAGRLKYCTADVWYKLDRTFELISTNC